MNIITTCIERIEQEHEYINDIYLYIYICIYISNLYFFLYIVLFQYIYIGVCD